VIKYSLAFLAGNVILHQFSQLNTAFFFQLLYAAIVFVFSLFILGYFSHSYHYKKSFYIAFCLSLVFFTAFFSNYYTVQQLLLNGFSTQLEAQEIVVEGFIDSIPVENDKAFKFNFKLTKIINPSQQQLDVQFKQRIRLSLYKNFSNLRLIDLNVGDYWQFKLKLKRASGLLNAGSMDYEKWLFSQQIVATGYIRKGMENKKLSDFQSPTQTRINKQISTQQKMIYVVDRLRHKMAKKLDNLLADNEFKGIYLALALGIKDQINSNQWKVFLDSGTNHLIAISGLHIGLFASLGFFIGKAFWSLSARCLTMFPAQQFAAFCALSFAFVYAAMAGFSIPTQRALIMISLALITFFFKLRPPPALILSYALIIVLILDPMASLSIGFWLSFAAVAVILYSLSGNKNKTDIVDEVADDLTTSLKHKKIESIRHYLKAIALLSRMQLIIFLGLLPLSLFFFSKLLLFSPIANLLAVPWMSLLITPLVLYATLISVFSSELASFLFTIISHLMQPLWLFLKYLIQIESNSIFLNANNILLISPILLGLGLFFMFKHTKKRWFSLLLIFPLLLIQEQPYAFLKQFPAQINQGQFKVTVLDVGQGLSVVVQTQNHLMLYDTGNSYSPDFDMAKQVVIPFLRYHSIPKIDKFLLSHADHDHVGSAPSLLAQFNADEILSGEPQRLAKKLGIYAKQCLAGQKWVWDKVEFQVLYPQQINKDTSYKSNNRSCVVLIKSIDGLSLLLTGDIEKKVEKKLFGLAALKNVDILVAPHHGSKSSSSMKFLGWLGPKIVVFTNAYLNRYSFPAVEVLQRYRQLESQLYSTENGMISIVKTEADLPISVTEYRKHYRHYWNRPHKALQ
jgi:competence protein ComEC